MAAGRKSTWSYCLLWGGDTGGVSFQVWMHTVNSISKKEGLLCRTGNRYLLYTVTAFTVLQLPFKLHERRSYLENLSVLLMKKSIDKNQGGLDKNLVRNLYPWVPFLGLG